MRGKDSRHQFKRDKTNTDSIVAELAASANSGGGLLLGSVGKVVEYRYRRHRRPETAAQISP